jgi:Tol biopolymer transport system component
MRVLSVVVLFVAACSSPVAHVDEPTPVEPEPDKGVVHDPREVHLSNVKQLTYDSGENAEAYWSFDGSELVFQTKRPPYSCDQIMRMPADGSGEPVLVSTGEGATTCSYFLPGNERIVYASTHLAGKECPPRPDHSQGYVWPLYDTYDIFSVKKDGSDLVRLTDNPGYDAEATVCAVDGSIISTSTRDGDLELYRMDSDGKNVKRLTSTPGYDGGAFFSADCKQIIWRASRPTGDALADYQRLLAQDLVRPSRLELYIANADGSDPRQITYLNSAAFAPYLHPNGKRILFSSNFADPLGREFNIWAIDTDGTNLEQITYTDGFDGFPMFSPDGTKLAFASNRHNAKERETDVYVADWVDGEKKSDKSVAADRFMDDVRWLADDARQGRGVDTKGLEQASTWLANEFTGILGTSSLQPLTVPVAVKVDKGTYVKLGKKSVPFGDLRAASFSDNASVTARTVSVDYGIVAPDLGLDDYKGKRVKGRIAVIRRFVPAIPAFEKDDVKRRYSDLHYKAFTARERGAVGVLFVDVPVVKKGEKLPEEAALPELRIARLSNVGIPVLHLKRAAGQALLKRSQKVSIGVQLLTEKRSVANVVGHLKVGKSDRIVIVGAHYDHLGFGGESSLEPGVRAVHNGADDNASGTAGLLAVARELAGRKDELVADVIFIAFTAEESGLLGSAHYVRTMKRDAGQILAMLNMDMIGRLRDNTLGVLGGETAAEWPELVQPICAQKRVACVLGGDGYGPSDQTPFYAEGVPVLQFFTGAHDDYHKTTDDTERVNGAGGAQTALIVAEVAAAVSKRNASLTYKKVAAPLPEGDSRSFGARCATQWCSTRRSRREGRVGQGRSHSSDWQDPNPHGSGSGLRPASGQARREGEDHLRSRWQEDRVVRDFWQEHSSPRPLVHELVFCERKVGVQTELGADIVDGVGAFADGYVGANQQLRARTKVIDESAREQRAGVRVVHDGSAFEIP